MSFECPSCKTILPDGAMYCDCGKRFYMGDDKGPQIQAAARPEPSKAGVVYAFAAIAQFATLGGVALAVYQMLEIGNAQSAPQQAAGAAMACAYVIIPYCGARAIGEIARHVDNK